MRISDWSSDVCSSDLWIVDHSPFHMNAPDMSACVGPVLFRHDPPQCGEVGGFGARSDETAIEPANHRENQSEFGLAHIQKGAVLGDALDCARRMVGPRSEEHTSELQSLMRISYAVFF